MRKWYGVFGIAGTLLGALCVITFMSCSTGGGGGGGGGDGAPTGPQTGALQPPIEQVAARPQAINPRAANPNVQLPASADLTGDLPPIGDQGQLGSCTAWASGYAGATYTANRAYQWGAGSLDHQASPGYLYNTLLSVDQVQCGSGTYISTAMNLLVQTGCSSLQVDPYTDQQCVEPTGTDAANFQVGSFNQLVASGTPGNAATLDAVKGELADGKLVVIGANLYDDFFDYTGGVYTGSGVLMEQGQTHAAHAMAAVGYDDAQGAMRIMNSWGTGWGEGGLMWMAYGTFQTLVFEAYSIQPSTDRDPDDGGTNGPEPGTCGTIDEAFQFADSTTGEPIVYLVFFYHFDTPVYIETITVTDPSGNQGVQAFEQAFTDGYVFFAQTGGFQFEAGTYTLSFKGKFKNGENMECDATAVVDPLGEDNLDPNQICYDYCIWAFDGECDDGGPDSAYALCELGTDCTDCGPRDGADPYYYDPHNYDWYYYNYEDDWNYYDPYYDYWSNYDYNWWDWYYQYGGYYGYDKAIDADRNFTPAKSPTKVFRGIPVESPRWARSLPAAGVGENTLGSNRQPVKVIPKTAPK